MIQSKVRQHNFCWQLPVQTVVGLLMGCWSSCCCYFSVLIIRHREDDATSTTTTTTNVTINMSMSLAMVVNKIWLPHTNDFFTDTQAHAFFLSLFLDNYTHTFSSLLNTKWCWLFWQETKASRSSAHRRHKMTGHKCIYIIYTGCTKRSVTIFL